MGKLKKHIVRMVIGTILLGSSAVTNAQVGKKNIPVVYNDIKLIVNGVEINIPKENEPLLYNGTTYVPLRVIAQVFKENIEFNKNTYSVYIGEKINEVCKIDDLAAFEGDGFIKGDTNTPIAVRQESIPVFNMKEFYHYRKHNLGNIKYAPMDSISGGYKEYKVNDPTYLLKGEYSKLEGFIGMVDTGVEGVKIKFYGDGELLETLTAEKGEKPTTISIDVTGVDELKIVHEGFGKGLTLYNVVLTPMKNLN